MPSVKDRDLNASLQSAAGNIGSESSGRQQPIAMEVPVTVNGARALEGEKREPFSESTKTVLVFNNGAVIRLGSVVAPGQLLFLTNQKTKKEVICQVLKSKSDPKTSGYVELEFTEPVTGFWGLRFPADHAALRATLRSHAESPEFLRTGMESIPPVVVAAQMDSTKVPPAASIQFKTELKADERSSNRTDFLASAEAPTETPKVESSKLQEQLSALMLAEQTAPGARPSSSDEGGGHKALSDSTAKLFELAEANSTGNAAPENPVAKTLSTPNREPSIGEKPVLKTEELKVPSWLEPLAHSAAASSRPHKADTKDDSRSATEPPKSEIQEKPPKPAAGPRKAVKAAPVFGNTLLGQSASAPTAAPGGKGVLVAAIAAGILVAAAGATWYLSQPPALSLPTASLSTLPAPATPTPPPAPSTESNLASSPQQTSQDTGSDSAARLPLQTPSAKAGSSAKENSVSASSTGQLKAQPAVMSERVPKASAGTDAGVAAMNASPTDAVEPDAKKPSLGKVRLAKPKVGRNRQSSGVVAPTLTEADGQAVPAGAAMDAALGTEAAAQPSAPASPTPVGGDVKPARLLSSVPPVYPPMARSQHVAGDVRIDASIDANGRVSSMKVISGPALLHQAAMEALRQWKYQPATLNGSAVAMHLTVTIQFHLQ